MPINCACGCGRRLRVPDRLAGKFARCPACGSLASVPGPQPAGHEPEFGEEGADPKFVWSKTRLEFIQERPSEPAVESCELEVVKEDSSELEVVEEDSPDLEVIEEDSEESPELEVIEEDLSEAVSPVARQSPPKTRDAGNGDDTGEEPDRPRKKRKKAPPPEPERGTAGYYMEEARKEIDRKEKEKTKIWSRGNGLTMFGVHITAGVVSGTLMLASGLLCLVVIGTRASRGMMVNPRVMIGAVVYTSLGAATLLRSLVYGQED